jgi:hypothetical protein
MIRRAAHMVAIVAALAGQLPALLVDPALAATKATVDVRITVTPFAEIELPNGANFVLRVPHIPHCSPKKDRDWDYWKSVGDNKHKRGKNDRDDWDNWRDDDWNRWGDNGWWDDWDDWNGNDWQHHGWYNRCKRWLSDWYWPVIRPVRIPFTVTGNALASVSVKPHQFLKIKSGKYLGKATGPGGRTLGYDTIVHFPAPKWNYYWLSGWDFYDDWHGWRRWAGFGSLPNWSRWAKLPGTNNTGTPSLTTNMVQRGGKAHGVVYIVSRRDFTTDGKKAKPGDYAGTIVLTVVADNI